MNAVDAMLVADVDTHMLPDAQALLGLDLLVHPEVVHAMVGSAVGTGVGTGVSMPEDTTILRDDRLIGFVIG